MSIDKYENVEKLIDIFQRFGKADWRKKTILGLKASEMRVLLCVKQGSVNSTKGTTVKYISKRLHVTSPTVTQMVNNLIEGGYVYRKSDTADRRITEIMLTEKGEQLADAAKKRYHDMFIGMIDHLGKEQSDQLIELLNQVFEYLDPDIKKDSE
ncbi:MarR family winged helix-turn-helix transcriptional regulator [Paenibacillus harenae]|uniref:DNA-binding MarR family transcriptional regulator n=1 Tax=Paenibacillus harenae TaxID=306543 RepID=A0ABT9TY05_PAEHA|nr:MarR family winged helix-turn-helix transcriptional regulator [Paenibacillus harenae]MDQ0058605.1 DNA-binding MarR family transcriptional regulator [Paenibacillus harenae]MDQ0111942.1 DNA-binding MarR family transcriptional regulator [Paenibacillus harenae]